MWRIFENPAWKTYKDFAAARGLLLWVGTSGVAMAVISAIAMLLWASFLAMPGPIRFVVAIMALLVVGGLFAVVRYVVNICWPIESVRSKVTDRHGSPFNIPAYPSRRKVQSARLLASLITVLVFGVAFWTGALDKLAANIKPETLLLVDCQMTLSPISVAPQSNLYIIDPDSHFPSGLTIYNTPNHGTLWPEPESKRPFAFYQCFVTNFSHDPVFSVHLSFPVSIRESVSRKEGGTDSGKVISSYVQQVDIPVINPDGGRFCLYVLNHHDRYLTITIPDGATVEMPGGLTRRSVPVKRTGIPDQTAMYLGPEEK